jgi:DNA ligase (NAD+)
MDLLMEIKSNKDKIFSLSKDEFLLCIETAKDTYYNNTSVIDDDTYDLLEETYQEKYPSQVINTGSLPETKKIKLPYEMYSMNKIKNDPAKLKKFFQKYTGEYVISDKLDGVSALYIKDTTEKLYTRGNGKIGQDISYLLKYINIPQVENVVLRGELIISKDKFEKYKNEYSTGRNYVSSIVNSLNPKKEYIEDIDLVFYEVIKPILIPFQQMEWLKGNQYAFSPYKVIFFSNTLTNDLLKSILLQRKEESIYEIDGIIINHNFIHQRTNKNPSHAFAYKTEMEYQITETEVVDVEWNVSKDGLLKPKIKLVPITINNINIEYVSGYNGFYIESNKIGKGTKVEIIRSGDVIPVIRTILQSTAPLFPEEEYEWDSNHVELKLKNKEENKKFLLKEIVYFFKGLKITRLGTNYIEKLIDLGYDSIEKILLMKEEDIQKIKTTNFHKQIQQRMKEISQAEMLSLLNYLGRGYSKIKIESIEKQYPELFDFQVDINTKKSNLEKINKKTAEHICQGVIKLEAFLKNINYNLLLCAKEPAALVPTLP